MCDECARLQAVYSETAERLLAAQRELARSGSTGNPDFQRLWKECETGLRTLWSLREDMTAHTASHSEGTTPAEAN